jgi:hypothetical protein
VNLEVPVGFVGVPFELHPSRLQRPCDLPGPSRSAEHTDQQRRRCERQRARGGRVHDSVPARPPRGAVSSIRLLGSPVSVRRPS